MTAINLNGRFIGISLAIGKNQITPNTLIIDLHGVFNAVPYDFFNSLSTDMSGNQITQHISGRTTFLNFGVNVLCSQSSVPTSQPNLILHLQVI
jgi:hypothetical protein